MVLSTEDGYLQAFQYSKKQIEYFLDNLHPNPLGCEVYGRNLASLL